MLTTLAATLLTIATASPAATGLSAVKADHGSAFNRVGTTTLATVMPTPGAWALMGMGGLALVRSRRDKR